MNGKITIYTVCLILCTTVCVAMNPLETAMNNGKELFKKNLFDEAALFYLKAVELAEDNTVLKMEALLLAGDCQLKNDPIKAKETFSKILMLQVSSEQKTLAQIKIAQCFLEDGEFESVITKTTQLLELHEIGKGLLAEIYYIKGESFFRLKQFPLAIECFKKALACKTLSSKQIVASYSFIGNIYMNIDHMSPLSIHEKLLQMERKIDVEESFAWGAVIKALTNSQQFDESNKLCQQILKDSPEALERKYALMYQAKNLFGLKLYDAAAESYEKFYLLYSDLDEHEKASIKLELALCLSRNKKYRDALEVCKQVLKFNDVTCSPMAQLLTGYCYFELNDYSNSLQAFKEVLTMPVLKRQYKLQEEAKRKIIKCEKQLQHAEPSPP